MKIRELIDRLHDDSDYQNLLNEPEISALSLKDTETELSEEDYRSLKTLFDRLGEDLRKELFLIAGYEEQLESLGREMGKSE